MEENQEEGGSRKVAHLEDEPQEKSEEKSEEHSEERLQERTEKLEKVDSGQPTLVEEPYTAEYTALAKFTALRHAEADSVSRSRTPGSTSTPQEAIRSFVMATESSEDHPNPKEPETKPEDRSPEDDGRYISNSAPEALGRNEKSKPRRRMKLVQSTGEGSSEKNLKSVKAIRDSTRQRYQALRASMAASIVHSPKMARFMASQAEHHAQGEDVHFTVKSTYNQYVTYKIQPSGQAEIVNMRQEIVSLSHIYGDLETSPVSSKSSNPSIVTGELANVSSLSRSSGDHSSGSFTRQSMPPAVKKTPSVSSSYDPNRK